MRIALAIAVGLLLVAGNAHAGDAPQGGTKHTVVAGDTLSGIAHEHGVSVDDLRRWNSIEGDVIRLGEQLRIGATGESYTVKRGDTLSRIASQRGVTVGAIVKLNPGLNPNKIRGGQQILVPRPKVEPPPPKEPLACPGLIVQIGGHAAYRVRNRHLAWATSFTADALRRGFTLVRQRHGTTTRARVLDASSRGGGQLGHHRSHRTGRDVDITYFQKHCGPAGCPIEPIRPDELDVARQWTLLRYWLDKDDVEFMFVDWSLQKPIYEQAKAQGATEEQLDEWFQYPRPAHQPVGIIRHWEGHKNHVHVRFHETPCDDGCCSQPEQVAKAESNEAMKPKHAGRVASKRRSRKRRRR